MEVLGNAIRKGIKLYSNQKGKLKTVFAGDTVFFAEILKKKKKKKSSELLSNNYSKVSVHQINI